ncbi:MAG: hypothetical protein NUV96_01340 [Candidatus Colwellbacteria bacterium]|nr:hypothetical protein [Candidatus Colwellbacteria bacterium]
MIKLQGKTKPGLDRWLLITSIILSTVMIVFAVSSIIFLSENLLKAFTPKGENASDLKFNIEEYEQVLSDLGRTPATTDTE